MPIQSLQEIPEVKPPANPAAKPVAREAAKPVVHVLAAPANPAGAVPQIGGIPVQPGPVAVAPGAGAASEAEPQPPAKRGFSWWNATKSFFKGVTNIVTHIVEHPVQAIGMFAATAALVWAAPVLGTVLIAGGILMSAGMLAKGTFNAVRHAANGDNEASEKSFENIGEGTLGMGLSMLGIRSQYGALGLRAGTKQCFKDAGNILKEIGSNLKTNWRTPWKALPQEDTVILVNTTNKGKLKDIQSVFSKAPNSKRLKILTATEDAKKSQVKLPGLAADEAAYGEQTYANISRGKVTQTASKDIMGSRVQNVDARVNGKTLSEAFPGRKVVLVTDDSGFELLLASKNLPAFRQALSNRGLTHDQIEAFISTEIRQGSAGLQRVGQDGAHVDLMGIKSHPNLDSLAAMLGKVKDGKPDGAAAEAVLADIMTEINVGGRFAFHSGVSGRNVLAGGNRGVSTHVRTTNGQITNQPHPEGLAVTDPFPMPQVVEIMSETAGLNGTRFSVADRSLLSRAEATRGVWADVDPLSAGRRGFISALGGGQGELVSNAVAAY